MRILTRASVSLVAATSVALCTVLRADPVTVQEVGVGANETVYIDSSTLGNNLHVYAGVLNLSVNGNATQGFCIDPWHWSASGVLNYNTEALSAAPKPPGPMGAAAATQIEQLWSQFFTPSISNINAAALQLEIWTIVDNAVSGGTFHLDSIDHDSVAVLAEMATMNTFLANNPNAPTADLIAVTGAGQDYVIPNVPEGGSTIALLGLALAGMVWLRRKIR